MIFSPPCSRVRLMFCCKHAGQFSSNALLCISVKKFIHYLICRTYVVIYYTYIHVSTYITLYYIIQSLQPSAKPSRRHHYTGWPLTVAVLLQLYRIASSPKTSPLVRVRRSRPDWLTESSPAIKKGQKKIDIKICLFVKWCCKKLITQF